METDLLFKNAMFKVGRLIKMGTIKGNRALEDGAFKARIGIKVRAVEFSSANEIYSVEKTTRCDGGSCEIGRSICELEPCSRQIKE